MCDLAQTNISTTTCWIFRENEEVLVEIYLYYSYLKFRHDRKKPIWIIIKSFPWWIWLALGASAAGVFTFILSFPTARGELWRKLVIIGSLACIKFANIGIERIQIRESKERMKNFWI